KGRKRVLAAKWLVLLGMELFALVLAVGSFAAGFALLGKGKLPLSLWLTVTGVLWFGSFLLYLWHLFLNLRFSKTISMGVGMAESLISALLLTGLGDGIWQYVPASYSARGSLEILRIYFTEGKGKEISGVFMRQFLVNLLITVVVCVIIFLWFQFYEGKACDD
ncbi:MAG: lantibiotic immunity ABC transporter MutG family permease subunit, partial [Roseburia sp.]|nr:lantibiotic immunity ABC transporter MutG family permease subunit [Roseburia sp.]